MDWSKGRPSFTDFVEKNMQKDDVIPPVTKEEVVDVPTEIMNNKINKIEDELDNVIGRKSIKAPNAFENVLIHNLSTNSDPLPPISDL